MHLGSEDLSTGYAFGFGMGRSPRMSLRILLIQTALSQTDRKRVKRRFGSSFGAPRRDCTRFTAFTHSLRGAYSIKTRISQRVNKKLSIVGGQYSRPPTAGDYDVRSVLLGRLLLSRADLRGHGGGELFTRIVLRKGFSPRQRPLPCHFTRWITDEGRRGHGQVYVRVSLTSDRR